MIDYKKKYLKYKKKYLNAKQRRWYSRGAQGAYRRKLKSKSARMGG